MEICRLIAIERRVSWIEIWKGGNSADLGERDERAGYLTKSRYSLPVADSKSRGAACRSAGAGSVSNYRRESKNKFMC